MKSRYSRGMMHIIRKYGELESQKEAKELGRYIYFTENFFIYFMNTKLQLSLQIIDIENCIKFSFSMQIFQITWKPEYIIFLKKSK